MKPLSDTRWESRINSVKVVRFQTEQIYNALIKLSEVENIDAGTRHEAVSLADQLTDFKFLISLVVWYDILFQVNLVSKSLQAKAMDLINGSNMLKSTLEFIKNYRDQFDQFLVKAKAIADELGVDSEIKVVRKRIKKKNFDYERSDDTDHRTAVEKFKHEFFYTLMDVVTTSLTDRFEILKIHVDLWNVLYDFKNAPENENELLKHCMDLHNYLKDGSDSDIDGVELCTEIVNVKQLLISCLDVSSPLNILQYIFDYELQDIFPNLWIALRLLLTLPVTVASGNDNWETWKFQIKVIMTAADIFDVVTGASKKPVLTKLISETEDEARKRYGVDYSIFKKADNKAQNYIVTSSVTLIQQKFYSYVKNPDDNMAIHISKLESLSRKLKQLGEPISDSMLMTKILMTLPENYKHFYSA
ncbi:hypothetical protein QTP88_015547 [Uroleucon formosanum]